jgi:hypothetical protein
LPPEPSGVCEALIEPSTVVILSEAKDLLSTLPNRSGPSHPAGRNKSAHSKQSTDHSSIPCLPEQSGASKARTQPSTVVILSEAKDLLSTLPNRSGPSHLAGPEQIRAGTQSTD